MKISLVIPVYDDAEALSLVLEEVASFPRRPEVVVVDASPDKTPSRRLTERFGAVYVAARRAGRGTQLRQGAAAASGDVLVFHHADTRLTFEHLVSLTRALELRPALLAGAFFKDIGFHYPRFAWAIPIYRFYSRSLGVLYGDQSVFLRRDYYDSLGRHRDIPIMEDVDLSARIRRGRKYDLLDPPIRTSMRKFLREGFLRRKVHNVALVMLFRLGVSPERIYRLYYQRAVPS